MIAWQYEYWGLGLVTEIWNAPHVQVYGMAAYNVACEAIQISQNRCYVQNQKR